MMHRVYVTGVSLTLLWIIGCSDNKSSGSGDTDTDSDADGDTNAKTDTENEDSDDYLWDTNPDTEAAQYKDNLFRGVSVVDAMHLLVRFREGDVKFVDDGPGDEPGDCGYNSHCNNAANNYVVTYGDGPLDTNAATNTTSYTLHSADDTNYSTATNPDACYRKSKLNGMAQMGWDQSAADYSYEYTMAHQVFLSLPTALEQGKTYTLQIDPGTGTDVETVSFTYDIYNSRSEALHVNLSGYAADAPVHAADLYIWMGDGGARDYSGLEGNAVYLYNVGTDKATEVGTVTFGQPSQGEAQWYNFTQSDVWYVDFTGNYEPGIYRLAVEGVGASQNFVIGSTARYEPFRTSVLGFFYMRIGQDNLDMTPVPRRPLWIPGIDPADTKIVVTDMHPYRSEWAGGGDRWDQPEFFAGHVKSGSPENPDAVGGHSDALDWDRHLGHVSIIYDMLLPYILTNGAIGDDDLGIAESGNGVPDIIDEAQNEVDFWLSLRHEGGYSHGLTNPDHDTHVMYQADNTAISAWANAVNAAMLAKAYAIAGDPVQEAYYLTESETAYNYAGNAADPMLDALHNVGEGTFRGRDLKMTAAAFLYDLTGNTDYEDVINDESLIANDTSEFVDPQGFNQLYAMAAYLHTSQDINYPTLHANMQAAAIYQAMEKEAGYSNTRPSRRATDNLTGYFHTIQNVSRTILAHSVAADGAERDTLESALILEADWGLGRNPSNAIQMTTATTPLSVKRSVENAYTSGRDDGTPGMHPGHTPYFNIDDWHPGMIMGRPSWMLDTCYPTNTDNWPREELRFNTRYVWSHSEFTPQQTMRGKMALYGYLYGLTF